jgi:alkyl hydroperoxide reductase subunit AhpC
MGADPSGKLARVFSVYDEDSGLADRGAFIISPEGKLMHIEVSQLDVGRNAAELVRLLKANIYKSGHPEEVCPAKWEPGQKTLKPSPEVVGKVEKAYTK